MKKIYFTPGPSQIYFTVEDHLKKAFREGVPSISHRSKSFEAIFKSCHDNLYQLFNLPEGYYIVFTSSATEIWERIAQNLVEKESFHFVNGAFSAKFKHIVRSYGHTAHSEDAQPGKVGDVVNTPIPENTELISLTYNETSMGVSHTHEDLKQLREKFPDQLITLDVVSASPSVEIDFSLVDSFYLSVQKCFGLPAGLGVWIMNERCVEKANDLLRKEKPIGSYHSIPELIAKAEKNQTPATPNVLGIYLLGQVAGDMLNKGVDQIRQETNYKAALISHMIDSSPHLSHFVAEGENRSKTTMVADCASVDRIIEALDKKGLVIGTGYGNYKKTQVRIANFPTHSKEQIERLSDEILALNFQ